MNLELPSNMNEDILKLSQYSFTEFAIKPELMLTYTSFLAENGKNQTIKQLARNYMDLCVVQYNKVSNGPNIQNFEQKNVTENQRLRIYVRLLVYIFYKLNIDIFELSQNIAEHRFIKFIFDSLVLFVQKRDDKESSRYVTLKKYVFQVYYLNEDFRYCSNFYTNDLVKEIISEAETSAQQVTGEYLDSDRCKEALQEIYYVLMTYFFLKDDFQKAKLYCTKFIELRNRSMESEQDDAKIQKKSQIINLDKVSGINESLDILLESGEEEANVQPISFFNSSSLSSMSVEDSKHNNMLLKNFEEMTNYMNLIPFKLDELNIAEKQKLADNLFYEYFSSLDKTLLLTLNAVEKKIDAKKAQEDTTKYVEFIISKLLSKVIEQTDNKETDFADVLESVSEAIKIFGLPSSQKYKIIMFCLSQSIEAIEAPDLHLKLLSQTKNILDQFYEGLFKDSSFSELSSLVNHFNKEPSESKRRKGSGDLAEELNILEAKKKKNYEYLLDFIIPYIAIQLRSLCLKAAEGPKENKLEEEKPKEIEDLKKMIGVFWKLLQQISYKNKKEAKEDKFGVFKEIIDKIWSNKLLATFKSLLNFLLYLFKENYLNLPEENEFPHSSLTIRLNATYLFSDCPEFMYLKNNKDEYKEFIAFTDYAHEKDIIMQFISLIGKAQKRIIKFTFEKEALVKADNTFAGTSKNEFKFQKDLMGVEIEKSKVFFIMQAYQKTIKKLLQCMNIATYSKVNPFEKLPKVLIKSVLYEILLVSFYCLNGASESLILLQFTDRFEDYDLTLITSTIMNFPHTYVDLIYYPTILEKLFERFYDEERLVNKLIERIKTPEVYQTNFEWKYSRSANQARINFIRSTYKYFIENRK